MGTGSGSQALAWALLALLTVRPAETQDSMEPRTSATKTMDSQRVDDAQPTSSSTGHVTFIPPITIFPTMSPLNPVHNGRVCSTWGDFHYKTFDGDIFHFPGLCNYVFSSHCGAAYEDFNIQLRRGLTGSRPTITHVVLKTQGLVLELLNGSVLVDGQQEKLPYSRAGLLVEQSSSYVKISVQLVLTFLWNGEDSALLELDPKYSNQTCGLCGDFNGLPAVNEFYTHNTRLTPVQFGNLQKLDGPTEQCQDPLPSLASNCTDEENICYHILLGSAFAECNVLVDANVYIAACVQDLCRCPTCPCATFAEYSRQCAHAGGRPQNWRSPDLCPQTCPFNMQHQECGSPCTDTCSNPQRSELCEDHCTDGCFCPPGAMLDDVTHSGCLPLAQCPCTHGGHTYAPGASFSTSCSSCTCTGGLWECQDLPCPGTCSVQGGSHISTYDEKLYDVHGDCNYILSKKCADSAFTVLAELRKCGLTDTENCLKTVTLSLNGGDTAIQIQANGAVFINSIYTQLPLSAANITIFSPSTFFILVQTHLGLQLQVQLVPLMQVFVRLDPSHRGQMCGLCGNFNQNQADDFTALSGVVEGTGAAFANTWKTQATCPNAKNSFEDPCSLSVENENYAQHWCSLLTDPTGVFSACHSTISPAPFHSNCVFDTCNCEKSEDCMCAALSSYVRACAAKGVLLRGWRDGVCTKYRNSCPKSQRYAYVVDACQPTCRALSEADVTCGVSFVPVDGCTCPAGTFLNDASVCVPAQECPCYFHGTMVAPGEIVQDNGVVCSCASGKLNCLGAMMEKSTGCVAPMVYLDCSNASAGAPGAECLRSCHTLDVDCFSTHCVSGCVCPPGLVADGKGGCVAEEDCPCVHNEATYKPGETVRVGCNTCTCRNHRWECTDQPCLGTCVAYGDGHFITFDGDRYSFEGTCEYVLAQDYCGGNTSTNGTFRVITQNVPCGTTGTTCSKAIKVFVESYELILHEGSFKVVERGSGGILPYKIRYMGIFLVIETRRGMAISWDRKTSVVIRLKQHYKGRVCGLCGNFDDNAINDFTTRSQSVVGNALEFGNSWKFSPSCPDALEPKDPCTTNPYRKSWAQKQCSIINSATFANCRSQVDSTKYYEACVSDACACDSGGDCECFCTAVAAYAQACHDVGVCVSWRTPDICPLFCDYYNPHGECEWHYQPCGAPCLKTCRNPSGHCLVDLPGLEGCYPNCPSSQPFFNEDQMKCVAQCGCYDQDGNYYDIGKQVPTAENCQSCHCTPGGLQCTHSPSACVCTYENRTYAYEDTIYNTTDGLGACLTATCGDNGTIIRRTEECPGILTTTPFTFTTTTAPLSTTSSATTLSTVCVREVCHWSDWYDGSSPEAGMGSGDFETFVNLRQLGYQVCQAPTAIECRAEQFPNTPLQELGQNVDCDPAQGLTCLNGNQSPPLCHNYQLRVLCCEKMPCGSSRATTSSLLHSPSTPTTESSLLTLPTRTTHHGSLTSSTQTTATKETTLQTRISPRPATAFTSQTVSPTPAKTVTRLVSSTLTSATTTCQPQCQWTKWFDTDYPKTEIAGGDTETYDRIRAAGEDLCDQPQEIECQAQNYPGETPARLGQKVQCDVRFGLVCRNRDQNDFFSMCFNYLIRVLCCNVSHCQGTATTVPLTTTRGTATTISQTLSSKPQLKSSPVVTHTPTGSTTASTSISEGPTTARLTETPITATTRSPKTPLGPTGTTQPGETTSILSTFKTTGSSLQPSTPASTTARTSMTGSKPGAWTSMAGTVPTETLTTSPALTTRISQQPTLQTEISTPRTRVTPGTTTEASTSQSTTLCQPKCKWTEWFDVDFPTTDVANGDMETYENIRAAGGKLCQAPEKIECRAENYPEVSIDQIGQVVTCSLETGLVCRNEDQIDDFSMCFNYNVRVLCCDYSHCPSTTVPALSSTTSNTSPTTSLWSSMVSRSTSPALPQTSTSSTGTTRGIVSISTTQTPLTSHRITEWSSVPSPSALPASTSSFLYTTGQTTTETPNLTSRTTLQSPPPTAHVRTVSTTPGSSSTRASFQTSLSSGTLPMTTGSTTSSSSLGSTHTPPGLTSRTISTMATSSITTPSSIPVTTHAPKTLITLTKATGSTTLPSSAHTTSVLSTRATSPVITGSTIPSSYKPESSYTPPVLTTRATSRVHSLPSSSPHTGPSHSGSTTESPLSTLTTRMTPPASLTSHTQTTTTKETTLQTRPSTTASTSISEGPTTARLTQTLITATTRSPKTPLGPTGTTQPGETTSILSTFKTTGSSLQPSTPPSTTARTSMTGSKPGAWTSTAGTIPTETLTTSPALTTHISQQPTLQTEISTPRTRVTPGTMTEASTSQSTTLCQPKCKWTEWFDVDFPTSGVADGDMETYENIRAAGGKLCQAPEKIECRAENYPEVSIDQIGQVVTCSLETGLVCRNEDQIDDFSMCFNYNVRVLCCDYSHCPSTTVPALSSTTSNTSPTTSLWSSMVSRSTSPALPQTSTSSTGTTRGIVSISTTQTPLTSHRITEWSSVPSPSALPASTSSLLYTIGQKTMETPNLTSRTTLQSPPPTAHVRTVSTTPGSSSTRASFQTSLSSGTLPMTTGSTTSSSSLGSTHTPPGLTSRTISTMATSSITMPSSIPVTTHAPKTLITLTKATGSTTLPSSAHTTSVLTTRVTSPVITGSTIPSSSKPESSYTPPVLTTRATSRVHFLPSSSPHTGPSHSGSTTESSLSTLTTRTTPPASLTSHTQTTTTKETTLQTRPSTTASTSISEGPTTARLTETPITATTRSPKTPLGPTGTTQPGETTSILSTFKTTGSSLQPSTPPSTTARTSMTGSKPGAWTSTAGTVPTETLTTSPALTTRISQQPTLQTEISTPRTRVTPGTTTEASTSQSTTLCQPKCKWTEWFDVDFPTTDVANGDMETYENIRAAGGKLCQAPEKIECRAENYPEVSIDQIGQVVTCSLETGLVCRNEDQIDDFSMCFNYNVRVLCCDYSHCPSTTVPALSSTTSNTSPTTSLWSSMVSRSTSPALPQTSTSTGTTRGIVSISTTQTPLTSHRITEWSSVPSPSALPASTSSLLYTTGQKTMETPNLTSRTTLQSPPPTAHVRTVSTTPGSSSTRASFQTSLSSGTLPMTTGSTTSSSSLGSTHTPPGLTSRTISTMATSSITTPSSIPVTTHAPKTLITLTKATGSTMLPSSAHTTSVLSTRATSPVITGSTIPSSYKPESSYTPPVLTTRATSRVHFLPSSSPHTGPSHSGSTTESPLSTLTTRTTPPASLTSHTQTTTTKETTLQTRPSTTASTSISEGPTTARLTETPITATTRSPKTPLGPTGTTQPGETTSILSTFKTTGSSLQPSTPPSTTARTSMTGSKPGAWTSTAGTVPTETLTTSPALTTHISQQPTLQTEISTPRTRVTPGTTTEASTSQSTTLCQPKCKWTEWFDVDFPTTDVADGDMETYENIRAAGGKLCQAPEKIECRAENYPEVSIDQIGQVVTCSLETGLVCRNEDQIDDFSMCFNYNVRVLCCDYSHCPSTTVPALSSTTSNTSPTTSLWSSMVSRSTSPALPQTSTSSTGTTRGIVSISTTQTPLTSHRITEWSSVPSPSALPASTSSLLYTTGQTTMETPNLTSRTTLQSPPPTAHVRTVSTTPGSSSTRASFQTSLSSGTLPMTTGSTTSSSSLGSTHTPPGLTSRTISTMATSSITTPSSIPVTTHAPKTLITLTKATGSTTLPSSAHTTSVLSTRATSPVITGSTIPSSYKPESSYTPPVLTTRATSRVHFLPSSSPHTGPSHSGSTTESPLSTLTTRTTPPASLTSHTQTTTTKETTLQTRPSTTASTSISEGPTTARLTQTLITATTRSPKTPLGPTGTTQPGETTSILSTFKTTGSSLQPSTPPSTTARTSMTGSKPGAWTSTAGTVPTETLTTSPALTTHISQQPTLQTEISTPRTRVTPGTTTEASTSQSTTLCQPKCKWTEWFDVDFPTTDVADGDMETYENIRAAGGKLCQAPEKIECRAENYPEVSIDQIGQVVTCSLETGLVCRNEDQIDDFSMCFNYNVRVLCCDYSHCPSTTVPALSSTTSNTSPTTSLWSSMVSRSTSPALPQTSTSSTGTTRGIVSISTTQTPLTSHRITEWSSVPSPSALPASTSSLLYTTGQTTMETPNLTSRTTLQSPPPTAHVRTVSTTSGSSSTRASFQTSLSSGTLPMTTGSTTSSSSLGSTHTPPGLTSRTISTMATSSITMPSSIPVTTHAPKTLITLTKATGSTTLPSSAHTTPVLTTRVTSPVITGSTIPSSSKPESSYTPPVLTTRATSRVQSLSPRSPLIGSSTLTPLATPTGTSQATGSPTFTSQTSPGPSSTAISTVWGTSSTPTSTKVTESVPSPGVTTTVFTMTASTASETPSKTQTSPLLTKSLTPSGDRSTACRPQCIWTDWMDEDYPTPGANGGDFETYAVLREAGNLFCEHPQDIQCRSENYPDQPLAALEQVVQCDVHVGLVCRNLDQPGPLQYCNNFQVRVLCCEDYSHCTTTSAASSSTMAPTSATGSTNMSTELTTGSTSPMATGSTIVPTSTPGLTHLSPELTTKTTLPKATGSTAAPTAMPRSTHTPPELTTRATSPTATGSTATPSPMPGSTQIPPELTTRATSPMATSSTMPPSFSPRTSRTPAVPSSSLLTFSVSTASPMGLSTLGPTTFSSPPFSPSPCFCRAFGHLFSPGDIIYNRTDRAGCHFYAVCNQHCDIDRFQDACPSSSPPVSSTPVLTPSLPPGCDNAVPPRQVNETWILENCTVARCEGNNHVILLEPEPAANVTCVNGHLPVKVWDQGQPCRFHYECECLCTGWGQSHYSTFDGTSYTFSDNCTYVLMREINPTHGNLTILIHNRYCSIATEAASCPRALQVHYESMEIILTTSTTSGKRESVILFDQVRLSRGISKNGVSVSVTGATMSVNIPAIGVSVTFDGRIFQVRLSYSQFNHNTEGQCGTCTNSKQDDCRRPDGTMAPTCRHMAKHWKVSGEGCPVLPSPAPSTSPQPSMSTTVTFTTPCSSKPLCELLLNQVFAKCHSLVPPGSFFNACISDSCQDKSTEDLCQSLEAYAALCRARGVCTDWRNATSGLCDLPCPSTKVYKPCSSVQPESCDSRTQASLNTSGLAEGCFCPDGQLLFSSSRDICVSECPCMGPDGLPKFPGEQWVSNCQTCKCEVSSVSVQCKPVQCETQDQPLQCGQPGFVNLTRPQADNPCCPETLCVCNTTTCPQSSPECGPGQDLIRTQEEGGCCPSFSCQPKLCAYNGTVYGVGANFPGVTPCHLCTCLSVDNQDPTVHCEKEVCTTTCSQGFEYSRVAGQCCGECVPNACLTPDGLPVQLNKTWVNSHVGNCTEYRCEAVSGVYLLIPQPTVCKDVSECRGILRKTGCCYSCDKVASSQCQVHSNMTILRKQDCATEALVNVTFCKGSCPGLSKYSMEAQAMEHQCTCCQESRVHQETVTMRCSNSTTIQHTYNQVDECSCTLSCNPPPMAPMYTYV